MKAILKQSRQLALAGLIAAMIGAKHINLCQKAALELVEMVGDVIGEVGVAVG